MAGEITPESCRRLESSLLRNENFAPSVRYGSLLKVQHTEPRANVYPPSREDDIDTVLGFLSPNHDVERSGASDRPASPPPPPPQPQKAGDKAPPTEMDRELAYRNPVSVYNWLRKNQPHTFVQDPDAAYEKGTSRANARNAKRANAAQSKKEEDIYDEDGILLDPVVATGSSRNKRKRDEDGGYRPKGGSGSRSRKKKDDNAKRPKRSSAVAPME